MSSADDAQIGSRIGSQTATRPEGRVDARRVLGRRGVVHVELRRREVRVAIQAWMVPTGFPARAIVAPNVWRRSWKLNDAARPALTVSTESAWFARGTRPGRSCAVTRSCPRAASRRSERAGMARSASAAARPSPRGSPRPTAPTASPTAPPSNRRRATSRGGPLPTPTIARSRGGWADDATRAPLLRLLRRAATPDACRRPAAPGRGARRGRARPVPRLPSAVGAYPAPRLSHLRHPR
jgi:hypothetical protein